MSDWYTDYYQTAAGLRERIEGIDRAVLALVLRGHIDRADAMAAEAEQLRQQLADLERADTIPPGEVI